MQLLCMWKRQILPGITNIQNKDIFLGLLASFTDYQPQVASDYHITQDVGDRTKLGERQCREGSRQQ